MLAGAGYLTAREGKDLVDGWAAVDGVLLLLAAELASWSIEHDARIRTEPSLAIRRALTLAALCVGALLVNVMLLGTAGVAAVGGSAARRGRRRGGGDRRRGRPAARARMRLLLLASLAAAIHVPHGYQVSVYATGLHHPTAIAFGPDGRLYVAQDTGQVVSVRSGSRAGRPFARGLTVPLGLLWRGRTLYVSESGKVEALRAGGGRRRRRGRTPLRPPSAGHDRRRARRTPLPRLGLDVRCVRRERPAQRGDPLVPARRQRPARGRERPAQSVRARVRERQPLRDGERPGRPRQERARGDGRAHQRGADYGWPSCWPATRCEG